VLEKAGLEDNNNFYKGFSLKDIQMVVTWSDQVSPACLAQVNYCENFKETDKM